jgi:glycosyltransferase involved in cell wall biosynthesis
MRVTMLTSSYPRFSGDGTAPFIQSISEQLIVQGHAVEVIAPYDAKVTVHTSGVVTVHRFRYAPVASWHIVGHARSLVDDMNFRPAVFFLLPMFLAAEYCCALRVARRQRAQLIYAHWVVPSGLVGALVARALRLPLAISLHGSDVFVALRNPVFGRVARAVFRQAAVVTACSPDLAAGALRLGAASERVHVIPYGVDPERFHPKVAPLERGDFGLAPEDVVLVSIGRVVPKKGFDVLIRALPVVLQADSRIRLLIGGDGPQREDLMRLATDLGMSDYVHLPGAIPWDRVPNFLAIGDLFILPSVRDLAGNMDGLPNVLMEALALGKPVVASQLGGVPLVVKDGENGLLCAPGDPRALAVAIIRLLNDPAQRERLGRTARAVVEQDLTWAKVVQRLGRLLEGIYRG